MIKNNQGFDGWMGMGRMILGSNIRIFSIYSMRSTKSPNLVVTKRIRSYYITTKVCVVFSGHHQL